MPLLSLLSLLPRRWSRSIAWSVVGAVAAGAPSASAQRLTGVVHDSTAFGPLASTVVSLLDAGGRSLRRTVTDRQGRYALPVSDSARTVQFRHIGFRPIDLPLPESARTGTAVMNTSMQRVPAVLDPVRVTATGCPAAATSPEAMALWEQAQSGFLASVVAREAAPANAVVYLYERNLRVVGQAPTSQTVTLRRVVSTSPISAGRTPEEFVTHGYTNRASLTREYFGPDADVLLDESFRATHCFSMARADPARPGEIGVSFVPGRPRDQIVDIKGTLWLTRNPLALKSLEYTYTELARPLLDAGLGGSLTFRTADNGVVVVDRWRIKVGEPGPRGSVWSLSEKGGTMLRASWPDSTSLRNRFPTVRGQVIDYSSRRPVAGANVGIEGTPFTATTGPDGRYAIADVLPAPYVLRVTDAAFADFGIFRTNRQRITVNERDVEATVLLDATVNAARAACGTNVLENRSGRAAGVFVLRIIDSTGTPFLRTVQLDISLVTAGASPVTLTRQNNVLTSRLSLCGIPAGTLEVVGVESSSWSGRVSLRATGGDVLDTATMIMRPPRPPAGARR
jgi:hypothetical protein